MSERIKYCKKRDLHYQSLGAPQRILIWCSFIATAFYLQWRLGTFNPEAFWFSLLLYTAEVYGVAVVLLHVFTLKNLTVRVPSIPHTHLSVDVFITIYNEKIDVLRRTVIAAKKMDYPHTLYILDDGRREEVRLLAEQFDCKYITRTNNKHAKAGNLNNGLKYSTGEFIVVLDVDHAPMRNFINRTLGYFTDEKVAFVQTPQSFYNLDSFQHRSEKGSSKLWSEQSCFFNLAQRGKDYWNAVIFCGSCAILRRSSLERIGGFATETVTEDFHTSLRLHKAGFKSVYHAEPLAFGIAPSQMNAFIKQRKRWGTGNMQTWRTEGILFSSGMLTIPQRLCYFASVLIYFDGWQRLFYYTIPAIVLLTAVPPLMAHVDSFLYYFVPYMLLHVFMMSEISRGYGRSFYEEQYNMALFNTFCASTLGWLKSNAKFVVTNKNMSVSLVFMDILPQVLLITLNIAAIIYGVIMHYSTNDHLTSFALWFNVFWALVCLGIASSVVRFALRCASRKRNDYRFQLPLKAEMNCGDSVHKQVLPIQIVNISGTGVMFRVPKHIKLAYGEKVSGKLQLPWDLPFSAYVRAVSKDEDYSNMLAIGCEFEWEDSKSLEQLEGFLYGSDLEWRTNRITERAPTLFERIFLSNSARAKARRASIADMQKTGNAYAYHKQRGY